MNMNKQSIAIIGAGVSGLSAARFLEEKGYKTTVFEREEQPGGLIRCRRVNGNLFHTCGGHVFNTKRQDIMKWFWKQFNQQEEFAKADRNSVVFLKEGKEIPYPIENHMFLFDEATQKNFYKDLVCIVRQQGQQPENFEEFLRGRFGETLYSMYFQPYNEKIWRRDLRRVPLSWLEGKLPMPTVEEMIFNNVNHVKEKNFVHSSFWYEKKDGSQFIADRLAEGLDIKYCSDVSRIVKNKNGWEIDGMKYDKVVFCGNIKDMVKSIVGLDIEKYHEAIDSLESHGTTAAFCEIDANPYSWIYLPDKNIESHRIICTGNFAASNNHNLPEGRITATVEFTDKVDKETIEKNLSRMPLHPVLLDYKYNPYTYPIQDADTRRIIRELKRRLAPHGFYFTGRFADWEYYNMDVAIGAALDTCHKICGE